MNMNGRGILRWHAIALMALTMTLTCMTYFGGFTGRGPYGGLADDMMAISGLVQAYPLMGLVAVSMWMGSRGPHRVSPRGRLCTETGFGSYKGENYNFGGRPKDGSGETWRRNHS